MSRERQSVGTAEGEVRCLWMLSVSHVVYHQDRYRYGVLPLQPHYTFTSSQALAHKHTHFHHTNFVSPIFLSIAFVHARKQTYISIRPKLRMMNVVTF